MRTRTKVKRKARALTPTGKEIKKRLVDLGMTQAEFCRRYGVAQNRMTDICRSDKCLRRTRKRVYQLLNIRDDTWV